jgi:hypothetical protein
VSRTEAASLLCSEPVNPGWTWPCCTPAPEALFDPFCAACWVLKRCRRHPKTQRYATCSGCPFGTNCAPCGAASGQIRVLQAGKPSSYPLTLTTDPRWLFANWKSISSSGSEIRHRKSSKHSSMRKGAGLQLRRMRRDLVTWLSGLSVCSCMTIHIQGGTATWPCTWKAADTSKRAG